MFPFNDVIPPGDIRSCSHSQMKVQNSTFCLWRSLRKMSCAKDVICRLNHSLIYHKIKRFYRYISHVLFDTMNLRQIQWKDQVNGNRKLTENRWTTLATTDEEYIDGIVRDETASGDRYGAG